MKLRLVLPWLVIILFVGPSASGGGARHHENSHFKHVLLISIDGMHAIDFTNYIRAHPSSALAKLHRSVVTYPHASCSRPSDSFPGLMAMVTGGSPQTTGVWYDDAFDRVLNPNGTPQAALHEMLYDESVDHDL